MIPMTAREQLARALELGHELRVHTRTFPDHPEAPPKFYISCTCGWVGKVTRSVRGANTTMAWHLGKAIADGMPLDRSRDGLPARRVSTVPPAG